MDEERDDKLVQAAGRLARSISPERDLWPGIEKAIRAPRRSRWTPMLAQAAAVILLVGASSGLTYFAMKDNAPAVRVVSPELLFEPVAGSSDFAIGPEYIEVRNSLAQQLEVELARLPPKSRSEVEYNLALIRNAIAEINAALKEEPTNANLQNLLLRTYQDELALMHRVGGLTQHVMSRRDI